VLVFASCVGNFAKSVMLPINAHVADSLRVSAAPIAALTAVPLVLGAFSGVAASAVARAWGKWTPYLVASIFLQLGLNLNAMDGAQTSYGFFMGARILQGLGWGVFDALLYSSIQDTYFVSRSRGQR
jgi:cyanate permease